MLKRLLKNFKSNQISLTQKRRLSFKASKLTNRKLVKLKGRDSFRFLQGMVTNDVRTIYPNIFNHFNRHCMHTFLLNSNGRVVTDLFVYNLNLNNIIHQSDDIKEASEDDYIFLECDNTLANTLVHILKIHRVRSKVDVSVNSDYQVWSIYPELESGTFTLPSSNTLIQAEFNERRLFTDPRLPLHYRCLTFKDDTFDVIQKNLSNHLNGPIQESDLVNYILHRYTLGIGEGEKDHPSGNCFALESNADFLQGVSFSKGCYIGQELTARIYHSGVIRKRLVPIEFINCSEQNTGQLKENLIIFSEKDEKLGKLRSHLKLKGLGLIYVDKLLKNNDQLIGKIDSNDNQIEVKAIKPFWWPKEILFSSR